jgi:O-antigen/teichoic acid export membrane protein
MTRVRRWAGLFARFAVLQAAQQAVLFAAGLMVVRNLGVEEFAIYAIAVAALGTFSVLSDSGVTSVVMARGGAELVTPGNLGRLVRSARRTRQLLEVMAGVLVIPLTFRLLRGHGVPRFPTLVILVLLTLTLHGQVLASLYGTVPLLQLRAVSAQLLQLTSAVVRLGLLAIGLLVRPVAAVALLAASIGTWVQVWATRLAIRGVPLHGPADDVDQRTMWRMAVSQLPTGLFYAFQPQIALWMLTVFGSVRSIADLSALNRLSVVLSFVQAALGTLAVPRVARTQDRPELLRRYGLVLGAVALLCAGILGVVSLFPVEITWVLGAQYEHLAAVLPLAFAVSLTNLFAIALYMLNASRAWIGHVWVAVPLTLALQAFLLLRMDLSTVRGALVFSWASQVPAFLVNLVHAWWGFRQVPRRTVSAPQGSAPRAG